MSRVALIGANSQIAKDLIRSIAQSHAHELLLFVRDLGAMHTWLHAVGLAGRYPVFAYSEYAEQAHDAVINFVGVGDPQRAAQMGADILDITLKFDDLIVAELKKNPQRRYIFISSGAVYGDNFLQPVGRDSFASYSVNNIIAQNYYAIAKLFSEVRHRSLVDLAIVDVRVFNYFSRYQSLDSRFFVIDLVNAIKNGTVFSTSPDPMSRDFLHPSDFCQLIDCVLSARAVNAVIDCYSVAPVEKSALLELMREQFGLHYEVVAGLAAPINATGTKPHYYSTNKKAAEFGYEPRYSSVDTLTVEIAALLQNGGIRE